jgi:hypothetical protein
LDYVRGKVKEAMLKNKELCFKGNVMIVMMMRGRRRMMILVIYVMIMAVM